MAATSTIPPNSLITVVGITGYIASFSGLAALQAGYRVRGTVRSLQRGEELKDAYAKQGITDLDTRLEFVVVDDLKSEAQLRAAFEGAAGVIHPALDLTRFTEVVFIDIAVEETRSALHAAAKTPSLKRLVLTSSIVCTVSVGSHRNGAVTDEVWNDVTEKEVDQDVAAGKTPNPMRIYTSAKVKAERLAWEFMEKEKPHFDLATVLPGTCIGPVLRGTPGSTAAWFAAIFKGDTSFATMTGPLNIRIDVRDCGKIHFESLITPDVGGKRILCIDRPFGWNEVLAIIRRNFPNLKTIPKDLDGKLGDVWVQDMDNSPAKKLVGEFIEVEKSLVDFGKSQGY